MLNCNNGRGSHYRDFSPRTRWSVHIAMISHHKAHTGIMSELRTVSAAIEPKSNLAQLSCQLPFCT